MWNRQVSLQAIVITLALLSVSLVACFDANEGESGAAQSPSPRKPTPLPSPTPVPKTGPACPVRDDVCESMIQVLTALRSGGRDGLMQLAAPLTIVCPTEKVLAVEPICAGAAGETRSGYSIGWVAKQLQFVGEADFANTLQEALILGAGQPQPRYVLESVACEAAPAPEECESTFAGVVSVSRGSEPPSHVALIFYRSGAGGTSALVGVRRLGPDANELRGGPSDVTAHAGLPLTAALWFRPWDPGVP